MFNLIKYVGTAAAALSLLAASPAIAQETPATATTTWQEAAAMPISADFPFTKQRIPVLDSYMSYVDEGEGPVVLFLHGNPTSTYLWRNVMPYAMDGHRIVAVDLIGLGDSGKPDIDYNFDDQAAYLDAFIGSMGLEDITLVIHDWGSALGMRYARLNEDNVRAIAFMEALVAPGMPMPSYDAFLPEDRQLFRDIRTPGTGEEIVLRDNIFIEVILPEGGVVRDLTEAEMNAYRWPFPTPDSRLPTLMFPRMLPIGGTPEKTTQLVIENGDWLRETDMPKLYFYGDPGAVNPGPVVDFFKANLSNLTHHFIGPGTHYVQEDNPHFIGAQLAAWLRTLPDGN